MHGFNLINIIRDILLIDQLSEQQEINLEEIKIMKLVIMHSENEYYI